MFVDTSLGCTLLRSAGTLRQVEGGAPAFRPLVPCWCVGAGVRGADGRPGRPVSDDRQHHRSRPPTNSDRKGGHESGCGAFPKWIDDQGPYARQNIWSPLRDSASHRGQASDIAAAPYLLERQRVGAVLADKVCDDNDLRNRKAGINAAAVILSKIQPHSRHLARCRYPQESQPDRAMLQPSQNFRRLATRYDRRTVSSPASST